MKSKFYVSLNMKTVSGFEPFACFELGHDRSFAIATFKRLAGKPPVDDSGVLHIDLVEKMATLPVNLQVLECSIEELGENIKILTMQLFKKVNLEGLRP